MKFNVHRVRKNTVYSQETNLLQHLAHQCALGFDFVRHIIFDQLILRECRTHNQTTWQELETCIICCRISLIRTQIVVNFLPVSCIQEVTLAFAAPKEQQCIGGRRRAIESKYTSRRCGDRRLWHGRGTIRSCLLQIHLPSHFVLDQCTHWGHPGAWADEDIRLGR